MNNFHLLISMKKEEDFASTAFANSFWCFEPVKIKTYLSWYITQIGRMAGSM